MVKPQLSRCGSWHHQAVQVLSCSAVRPIGRNLACAALVVLLALLGPAPVPGQAMRPPGDSGFRKLAPGVITEIHPEVEEEETFSGPRSIVELMAVQPSLEWQPNYTPQSETLWAMAKETIFRRPIWAMEFGFKPLRMIEVELPGPDGRKEPRQVWYLVYYVKNNGRHLSPAPQPDDQGHVTYTTEPVDHSIRFFPTFILQCHDVGQAYLDQVLPEAVDQIRLREDPRRPLRNSVTISDIEIPVSTEYEDRSVWGVATWVGIDPRADFFSVYVQGLTNAYRWQDPETALRAGDPPGTGRRLSQKTLQLNFWRPGDAIDPQESEVRFGVPNKNQVPAEKTADEILQLYRVPERLDYQWVYR